IKCTRFGNFNLLPTAGEQIIPRNFGHGPGSFSLNLRVSRTFGFGDLHKGSAASAQSGQKTATTGGDKRGAGGPSRGPTIVAGGGGGGGEMRGAGGGGMGMGGPGGGGGSAEKKYTLNVGLFFQNLLNNVNLSTP